MVPRATIGWLHSVQIGHLRRLSATSQTADSGRWGEDTASCWCCGQGEVTALKSVRSTRAQLCPFLIGTDDVGPCHDLSAAKYCRSLKP